MIVVVCILLWIASGLGFYFLAARSWRQRWKTSDAPLNYPIAALMGPAMLGCLLAEIGFRLGHR